MVKNTTTAKLHMVSFSISHDSRHLSFSVRSQCGFLVLLRICCDLLTAFHIDAAAYFRAWFYMYFILSIYRSGINQIH